LGFSWRIGVHFVSLDLEFINKNHTMKAVNKDISTREIM
jgi:hypothetical protein